jgi:hypothetical protein
MNSPNSKKFSPSSAIPKIVEFSLQKSILSLPKNYKDLTILWKLFD